MKKGMKDQLEFLEIIRTKEKQSGLSDIQLAAVYALLSNVISARHRVTVEKQAEFAGKSYASYLKNMKGIKVD